MPGHCGHWAMHTDCSLEPCHQRSHALRPYAVRTQPEVNCGQKHKKERCFAQSGPKTAQKIAGQAKKVAQFDKLSSLRV
jgi:hypothetical protein